MTTLIKKTITELTFMSDQSSGDVIRYTRLRIESEGAGRFFILSDENDFKGEGPKLIFSHPDDFLMLYNGAKEMYEQGNVFCNEEGW